MALTTDSTKISHWQPAEVKMIEGKAVRFSDVCVHKFSVNDDEDPEIYAAEPIWNWLQSQPGQWVKEHAIGEPYWIRNSNYQTWSNQFVIMARLSEQDQTFFKLKWGS